MEQKLNYAGIAGAVAGVVGILGVYSDWWASDTAIYHGTADVSGTLALAMSLGLFVFGGAYVLLADAGIRRAMGALMTICAVLLTLACVWGLTRADQVEAGATVESGMYVSLLGGLVGIAAGLLALRNAQRADATRDDAA
ncbi:MAG TPA: hypothetical protein VF235_02990 [Actinomycetota bacterium]